MKEKVLKVLDISWQVFKGLFIAALILAVFFNTYISILYYKDMNEPIVLEYAYPYNTKEYSDLLAISREMGYDSAEFIKKDREFNTKYNISYKTSGLYSELVRLHKEKPDSEEYKQTLAKLLEHFDISAEDITFSD